jgi:hypothetical protein
VLLQPDLLAGMDLVSKIGGAVMDAAALISVVADHQRGSMADERDRLRRRVGHEVLRLKAGTSSQYLEDGSEEIIHPPRLKRDLDDQCILVAGRQDLGRAVLAVKGRLFDLDLFRIRGQSCLGLHGLFGHGGGSGPGAVAPVQLSGRRHCARIGCVLHLVAQHRCPPEIHRDGTRADRRYRDHRGIGRNARMLVPEETP